MNQRALLLLAINLVFACIAPLPAAQVHSIVDAFVIDYRAMRSSDAIPRGLTWEDARAIQAGVVKELRWSLGSPVGYKAGAVTAESQVRLNVKEPVRGVLLRRMLVPDNTLLPVKCGVRPVVEADLMVTVRSPAINEARTIEDIARNLNEVIAFIEIPDTVLNTNPPPDIQCTVASNVGARLGILGDHRRFESSPEFIEAFGRMEMSLLDGQGTLLAKESSRVLYGHPLRVVLWLVEDLKRSGSKLRRGDKLSLGGVKFLPPVAGKTFVLQYDGLPGGPMRARVRF